jgi:hypothetical protein
MRHFIKIGFIFICAAVFARFALADPVEIDRTRRIVDVPTACLNNTEDFNRISFNRGGVVLNNIDARFTFVLSTTQRLQDRSNPALGNELAWFHFEVANPNHDLGLNNEQKLRRAFILARCGLPWTAGDSRLYQAPADMTMLTNFMTFAMGQGGADPRAPTGYTLVGNGEREGVLMYAARQIKMDLTPTIVAQRQVCLLYGNAENRSGCVNFMGGRPDRDAILGYLYEGINRVSYTGHEFWLMYSNPALRSKVYFTNGVAPANGRNVDVFLSWNAGAYATWNAADGNQTAFAPAPYRFQDLVDADNNRNFFQVLMPAFQTQYNQRILTFKQW